jgi:hypothetical protein
MEHSPEKLQLSAQRVANAYAEIANKLLGCTLPVPVPLSFDLQDTKPKVAGTASANMDIELNLILLEDNTEYILNDTLPHEIGHLVQFNKFDILSAKTQGHGAEWQEVMRKLGKTPHKFHTLNTARAEKHFKELKKAKKSKKVGAEE